MKPVRAATAVDRPVEEVYDFLDVSANHAPFLAHMLADWSFSGPERGLGAKSRARSTAPGPADWWDFEVVEAERPHRHVERAVSAKGKRRTQGTYTLAARPGGGTDVAFELVWLEAPRADRLGGPVTTWYTGRQLQKAMDGLAERLRAA